jgi:ferredoxin-thioredoxin reductase catalytic subunit
MSDTVEQNQQRVQAIAREHGLVLNPFPTKAQMVIELMAKNYDAVGEWVCPCKQENRPPLKGQEKTCPCPEWLDEIAGDGCCGCRLFYTPAKAWQLVAPVRSEA